MLGHLVLPALLPADKNFRAASAQYSFPTLAFILGRGQMRWSAPQSPEQWLLNEFQQPESSVAQLRALGEVPKLPWDGPCLCADPAHLHFTTQGLMLSDAATLDISLDEAQALAVSLNQEFADIGEFHAATPQRWYLRPRAAIQAQFSPLGDATGRRVDPYLPTGPEARLWHRYFNELQVFLHHHPINQAREQARKTAINCLWFWGQGQPPQVQASPYQHYYGQEPVSQGWARLHGLHRHDSFSAPLPAPFLALCADARPWALQEDHEAWCRSVEQIDQNWLAPALAALRAGQIQTLRLSLPGDHQCLDIQLQRRDLWKFWRRPLSVTALTVHEENRLWPKPV